MSTVPLAAATPVSTLATLVDDTLAAALAGRDQSCLWCGGAHVHVVRSDMWSGSVSIRCPLCGSELDGVVPRERREVRP